MKPTLPNSAKIPRLFLLWGILGVVYYFIEFLYRIPKAQLPHPVMIVVGGLCGVSVGAINQFPKFFNLSIRKQALIGTVVTLVVEFISGYILNIKMGLGIWDYSNLPFNIMGQVCILFGIAWLLLMPFAIWLEDRLRFGFGWNGQLYSLKSVYLEFIGRGATPLS